MDSGTEVGSGSNFSGKSNRHHSCGVAHTVWDEFSRLNDQVRVGKGEMNVE